MAASHVKLARGVFGFTLALAVVFSCIIVWQLFARHSSKHVVAWGVAGIFVMIAVPLSVYDVAAHLLHYVKPDLQRHAVRILWMVPIYAVESWLALRYRHQKIYLETARECYEAYAIFNFYKLMEKWLGTTEMLQNKLKAKPFKTVHHLMPFCFLPKWKLSTTFVRQCRLGTLQYVAIKVVLTLITFICQLTDSYGEGEITAGDKGYLYVTLVTNASQIWAMYCLVLFYHTLEKELAGLRPLPKLLVIKAVVFVSWWQGVAIAILAKFKYIKGTLSYSQDDVAAGLQDFLICIEMFVAALCHHAIFSWREFASEEQVTSMRAAFLDMLPFDVLSDAQTQLIPTKRKDSLASTDSNASGDYDFVPGPAVAPYSNPPDDSGDAPSASLNGGVPDQYNSHRPTMAAPPSTHSSSVRLSESKQSSREIDSIF